MVDFKRTRQYINKNTIVETILIDPEEYVDPSQFLTAYKGSQPNTTSPYPNPEIATTEFTDTEKSKLLNNDGNTVSSTACATFSGYFCHTVHRFVWDLKRYNTLPNILRKVEFGWDGYSSVGGGIFWHKRLTGWHSETVNIPTSDDAELEIVYIPSSMIGALIDNKLEVAVSTSAQYIDSEVCASLYTDYVYLKVTYIRSALINSPVIQPTVIGGRQYGG